MIRMLQQGRDQQAEEVRAQQQTVLAGQTVTQHSPAPATEAETGLLSPPGCQGAVHVPAEEDDDHGAAPGAVDKQGKREKVLV